MTKKRCENNFIFFFIDGLYRVKTEVHKSKNMQAFPIEIIDLIVANTDIDFVATYVFVCKRYSNMFSNKKQEFNFPLKERPFEHHKDDFIRLHREWAIWQNPFTQIPSSYIMIKYIPLYHLKFDERLLSKDFLRENVGVITKFQDSRSIGMYDSITGKPISKHTLVRNYHYELFYPSLSSDNIMRFSSEIYNFYLTTYERLEALLAKGILTDRWHNFIDKSNDISMYENTFKAHTSKNVFPVLENISYSILKKGKAMVKWILSTGAEIKPRLINYGCEWDIETTVYLYKKEYLKNDWIWHHIVEAKNYEAILPVLLDKIPIPTFYELFDYGSSIKVIELKYSQENREPNINELMMLLGFQGRELYNWMLGKLGLTKKDVLTHIALSNDKLKKLNDNLDSISWLLEDYDDEVLDIIIRGNLHHFLRDIILWGNELSAEYIGKILDSKNDKMIKTLKLYSKSEMSELN